MNRDEAITADSEQLTRYYNSTRPRPTNYNYEPFPIHTFRVIVGGPKWVVSRRTSSIVERYGDDVICLSQKRYQNAERLARLALTEGFD